MFKEQQVLGAKGPIPLDLSRAEFSELPVIQTRIRAMCAVTRHWTPIKKDTLNCHKMAHLALCLQLPVEKTSSLPVVPNDAFDLTEERRQKQFAQAVITSLATGGVSPWIWRHNTWPRPPRAKAKQNDQPIYTFAKHSFIINKSPFFCIKNGHASTMALYRFTNQRGYNPVLAKTAGGGEGRRGRGRGTLIVMKPRGEERGGASRQTTVRQEWGKNRKRKKEKELFRHDHKNTYK